MPRTDVAFFLRPLVYFVGVSEPDRTYWPNLTALLADMRRHAEERPNDEFLTDDDPGSTVRGRESRIGWVAIDPRGEVTQRWDIRPCDATATAPPDVDVRTTAGRRRIGASFKRRMRILWDHLGAGPLDNLPIYSCHGVVAKWGANGFGFAHWWGQNPDIELCRPPWSAAGDVAFWANTLKEVLATKVDDAYPDAIVCYAWRHDTIQIAVIRTRLEDPEVGTAEAPEWFVTGEVPKNPGLTITSADVSLMIESAMSNVLWKIASPGPLCGDLIWPRRQVQGVLTPKNLLDQNLTMARGNIYPHDVDQSTIEVTEPIKSGVRDMRRFYEPEGFKQETLIVRNANGTWTPAKIWVGEKLTLK